MASYLGLHCLPMTLLQIFRIELVQTFDKYMYIKGHKKIQTYKISIKLRKCLHVNTLLMTSFIQFQEKKVEGYTLNIIFLFKCGVNKIFLFIELAVYIFILYVFVLMC